MAIAMLNHFHPMLVAGKALNSTTSPPRSVLIILRGKQEIARYRDIREQPDFSPSDPALRSTSETGLGFSGRAWIFPL
jgi:hypothetical protein